MQRIALRRAALAGFAALAIAAMPLAARAADPVASAAARAADWLVRQQQPDGGFGSGFAPGSDVGATADAIVALAAAGADVSRVRAASGATAVDYLSTAVNAGGLKPGQAAKVVLALTAIDRSPRAFAGRNLIADVKAGEDAATGLIGGSVFAHALSVLALSRAKEPLPARAIPALLALQTPIGGWSFSGRGNPDVDTTALAAIALLAAGHPASSGPAGRALGYLNSLQNRDGGFPYESPSDYGVDSNSNSTALVALAMIAGGDQPESWFRPGGLNPLGHLVTAQRPSGALAFQAAFPDESILATIGAIPALARQSLR